MSKLSDMLLRKGLTTSREGLLPNHIRELLDLTIKMRIERFTKWEIQNYLSLTEEQMDWLWENALKVDSEGDNERRRWLARDRLKGGELPGAKPSSGDSEATGQEGHRGSLDSQWRTVCVHPSPDVHICDVQGFPALRVLVVLVMEEWSNKCQS